MKPTTLLRPVLVASLLLGSAAIIGCDLLPTGIKAPVAGTEIDEKIWNDYVPEYKVGMKWTWGMTMKAGDTETKMDQTKEVIKVENGVATFKVISGTGSPQESTDSAKPKFTKPSYPVKSDGGDDVTVPAGTYKGAAKFTGTDPSNGNTTSMWLVQGIGMVKTVMSAKYNDQTATTTIELKDFKK